MTRHALILQYHGAPFAGWQRQKDQPSVQESVERALARLDPGAGGVTGAGRTDAGVHALGQVAHCDLARAWDPFRLAEALNAHLRPEPVAVLRVQRVPDSFHARFSAVERRYVYRILERRAPLIHDAGLAWRSRLHLDIDAMRAAAAHLIGLHDFTTFRSSICQADSPVKSVDEITVTDVQRPDGRDIRISVRARSFLHNQVRSFVGTLERVGAGAWPPDRVRAVLEARDRTACGPVAPPEGLYLDAVRYEGVPGL